MTAIDTEVAKRGIFIQEFRDVVETKNILSDIATKLVSKAKNIYSPFTAVGVAKAYAGDCKVPVASLTITKDEMILDRNIGNAITDCKEELSYAKFNVIDMIRGDLYATVIKKQNTVAVADVVADATVVALTEDLSTSDLVREFLMTIKVNSEQTVGLKQKVDGATVKRAKYHGKPFVACGADAFVNIVSKVQAVVHQSSLKGIDGNYVETPWGVIVVNLGASADDAKRLIYGTAGVPTIAFREDQMEVDMGEIVSKGVATATDVDIAISDDLIEKTWYISAKTKGKNGIFSNVQSLVSTRLMA